MLEINAVKTGEGGFGIYMNSRQQYDFLMSIDIKEPQLNKHILVNHDQNTIDKSSIMSLSFTLKTLADTLRKNNMGLKLFPNPDLPGRIDRNTIKKHGEYYHTKFNNNSDLKGLDLAKTCLSVDYYLPTLGYDKDTKQYINTYDKDKSKEPLFIGKLRYITIILSESVKFTFRKPNGSAQSTRVRQILHMIPLKDLEPFYKYPKFLIKKGYLKYNDNSDFNNKSIVNKVIIPLTNQIKDLHSAGYVHRDIKPDNIMFNPETLKPTLIDYGLLKSWKEPTTFAGTTSYMSPGFVNLHHNSDIYQTACIIGCSSYVNDFFKARALLEFYDTLKKTKAINAATTTGQKNANIVSVIPLKETMKSEEYLTSEQRANIQKKRTLDILFNIKKNDYYGLGLSLHKVFRPMLASVLHDTIYNTSFKDDTTYIHDLFQKYTALREYPFYDGMKLFPFQEKRTFPFTIFTMNHLHFLEKFDQGILKCPPIVSSSTRINAAAQYLPLLSTSSGGGKTINKVIDKRIILGRLRRVFTKKGYGNKQYIRYKGQDIPLKDARSFEKSRKKNKKS